MSRFRHRNPRFTFLLLIVAGTGALLASPAWAGPGSAIDQYLESVPTADGKGESTRGETGGGDAEAPIASGLDRVDGVQPEVPADGEAAADSDSKDAESKSGEAGHRLAPEDVVQAPQPGFSTAVSSDSGFGALGVLLGVSLAIAVAGALFAARRKRAS